MIHDSTDVEIVLSENGALVAGPDEAVAALLSRLEIPDVSTESAGQSVKNLFADLTGVASVASAFDPKWVHLSSESFARAQELGGLQKNAQGLIVGVLRGEKGRLDQFLQFDAAGGINPMMMSNAATLAATMALRSAIAQLETLVESMDVKLDVLLEDNRTAAIGDVQGLTHVLTQAYGLYEKTGRISETVWSQITGHATALAQAESKARRHLDNLAVSVDKGSFAKRADAMHRMADGELQHWLIILAAVQANRQRLDVLKLAHLLEQDPDAVPSHAEDTRASGEEERRLLTLTVKGLSDAIASAADVSDANRVRNPLRSRKLIEEAEHSLRVVSAFAEVTGIEVVAGQVQREPWRKSVVGLAKGTASEARNIASSVPKEITRRREDNLIRKVSKIEERRALASESGDGVEGADGLTTPEQDDLETTAK